LGIATVGQWLDATFLRQLARNTNLEYSILGSDGGALTSSLTGAAGSSPRQPLAANSPTLRRQTLGARHYFANYLPLQVGNEQNPLFIEVALPVDDLIATENQALAVLVASTGFVALAGMLVAAWFIRRMTRPLGQLTVIARAIALGDFIAPIPSFSGPLEVATLAGALQRSHAAMRQALNELAQARDWLNNLVQSIVEGVILFDVGGRVTFFSQGAEGLLGWSSSEAMGRPIDDLVQMAEGGHLREQTPPPGQQRQWEVTTRANRPLTLAVTSARLAPLNSEPAQTALVLRDITEEEAGRHLRAYFLASITHEFRTPLSTLSASLELLLSEDEALSAAEMRELLKPSYLSLLSLQTLIDNLLESSKIEAGRFTIRRQPMAFDQVIANARRIVQPLMERRRHDLLVHGVDGLPPIDADAAHLARVMVNLLTNAAKYSPIGEAIDVCGELLTDRVRIIVADRGPGIPTNERAQLFRRFVRLDDQTGEQYGSGLGLYVVKTTVEAHGGQVGVEERPGGGSRFWFELPLSAEPDDPNQRD
jgi:PAS domain S-box-containing protein